MRWRIPDWSWRQEREPDPWKGLAAGALGGLGATLAMTGFQYLWNAVEERMENGHSYENSRGQEPGEHVRREPSDEPRAAGASEQGAHGEQDERSSEPATAQVAQKVSTSLFGHELRGTEKRMASQAMHYGFGIGAGATYGVLAELVPEVSRGKGLAFGAGLMALADELAIPALGLSPPPHRIPISKHVYGLAAHLVYGVSCELIREEVRRRLG